MERKHVGRQRSTVDHEKYVMIFLLMSGSSSVCLWQQCCTYIKMMIPLFLRALTTHICTVKVKQRWNLYSGGDHIVRGNACVNLLRLLPLRDRANICWMNLYFFLFSTFHSTSLCFPFLASLSPSAVLLFTLLLPSLFSLCPRRCSSSEVRQH